jgi:hypothetical protein
MVYSILAIHAMLFTLNIFSELYPVSWVRVWGPFLAMVLEIYKLIYVCDILGQFPKGYDDSALKNNVTNCYYVWLLMEWVGLVTFMGSFILFLILRSFVRHKLQLD